MRASYNLVDMQETTTRLVKKEIVRLVQSTGSTELEIAEPVEVAVRGIDEIWAEEIASVVIKETGEIYYLFSTADYEVEEHTILDGEWIRILEEIENTLNFQ
jgi:hypothetical protein